MVKVDGQTVADNGVVGKHVRLAAKAVNGAGESGRDLNSFDSLMTNLATCGSQTLVYFLRKMGKNVAGFQVNGKEVRGSSVNEKITLECTILSSDTDEASMKRAIDLAEAFSPVWGMLKRNVNISVTCRVPA